MPQTIPAPTKPKTTPSPKPKPSKPNPLKAPKPGTMPAPKAIYKSEDAEREVENFIKKRMKRNKVVESFKHFFNINTLLFENEDTIRARLEKMKHDPETIDHIIEADPLPNKAYTPFIVKNLKAGHIHFPEDVDIVKTNLEKFNRYKKKGNWRGQKNINNIKTMSELYRDVYEYEKNNDLYITSGEKNKFANELKAGKVPDIPGFTRINEEGEFTLFRIDSEQAANKMLQPGAIPNCPGNWCIKDPAFFEKFTKSEEKPYIVFKGSDPYIVFDFLGMEAKDIHNHPITSQHAQEVAPVVKPVVMGYVEKIKKMIDE